MAITKFNVSISKEDQNLSKLQMKKYNSSFTQFSYEDLKGISKNTSKSIKMLEKILSGEEPDEQSTVLAVKADQGTFSKFYGPMVVKQNDKVCLQMFDRVHELNVNSDGTLVGDYPDHVEVTTEFQTVQFNDFNNTVLLLKIFNDNSNTLISLYIPVKWQDLKSQKEADVLNRYLKKNPNSLLEYIGEKGSGKKDDTPVIKLKHLAEGDSFRVVGYQQIEMKTRTAFLLIMQPLDTSGVYYTDDNMEETQELPSQFKSWSNTELHRALSSGPVIDEDHPATLLIKDKRKTQNGVSVSSPLTIDESNFEGNDEEEELDFDM